MVQKLTFIALAGQTAATCTCTCCTYQLLSSIILSSHSVSTTQLLIGMTATPKVAWLPHQASYDWQILQLPHPNLTYVYWHGMWANLYVRTCTCIYLNRFNIKMFLAEIFFSAAWSEMLILKRQFCYSELLIYSHSICTCTSTCICIWTHLQCRHNKWASCMYSVHYCNWYTNILRTIAWTTYYIPPSVKIHALFGHYLSYLVGEAGNWLTQNLKEDRNL